jgi:hypothetical protein
MSATVPTSGSEQASKPEREALEVHPAPQGNDAPGGPAMDDEERDDLVEEELEALWDTYLDPQRAPSKWADDAHLHAMYDFIDALHRKDPKS